MSSLKLLKEYVRVILGEGHAVGGCAYEKLIQSILTDKDCGPVRETACDGHGADAVFYGPGKIEYQLEVKDSPNVFAGQKNCSYNGESLEWSTPDKLTALYDKIKLKDTILKAIQTKLDVTLNKLGIKKLPASMTNEQYWSAMNRWAPRRDLEVPRAGDLENDNQGLSNENQGLSNENQGLSNENQGLSLELGSFSVEPAAIYQNYVNKGVHYIQIGEGYGFYYLDKDIAGFKDIAGLDVPQFEPTNVSVRVRIKWGGSSAGIETRKGSYNTKRAAVIKQDRNGLSLNVGLVFKGLEPSSFDIEGDLSFLQGSPSLSKAKPKAKIKMKKLGRQ